MNTIHRLRRAGVTVLATAALSACADGFFFDPAPGRITPVRVQYTFVDGAAGAGAGVSAPLGAEGPQASPAAAFDKADGAHVVLRSAEKELFNQHLALEAVGSDKKVSFNVELPAGSAVQASMELTLLRGQDALFTGTATTQLTPGQASEVNVQLAGVLARVEAGGPYVIRTLGGKLKVTAVGLFATGDSAGLTATYRALDANITVASDGTVTAVSNGSGRVEASYFGRADTATVTVEDRCFGPFAAIAVGQTLNGALDVNDCLDAVNFSHNDWYQVTLGSPTLFRATLSSSGFPPFVGAARPDKTDLGVAADSAAQVVSEYYFPAGTYLLRAGSRARTAGPAPTGSYSLALATASVPQEGCFRAGTAAGATWVVGAGELSARLAEDDCRIGSVYREDLYGVRLHPGDTAVVTLDAPFDYLFSCDSGVRWSPAGGGRTRCAFTGDITPSQYVYLRTAGDGPFGNYTIRFDPQIPAGYDACADQPINMAIGATGSPFFRTGRLQRRIDCEAGNRVRDRYVVRAPSGAFRTTLTSADFDPFVAMAEAGRQGFGRASTSGSATAEWVLPGGKDYELRVLAWDLISSGGRLEGSYTVSAEHIPLPQEGCVSTTFVDFGSVVSGRITSDDCEDEVDNEPEVVRRWDGYSILLQPGESVSVGLTPEFPARFTHWIGGEFAQGHNVLQPGQTGTLVATNSGETSVFHYFYPITDQHNGTGNYTMTFSGAPLAPPSPVSGAARAEPPTLRLSGGR